MNKNLSLEDIKSGFNQSRDQVRIIALLSPTCKPCQDGQMVVKELFSQHRQESLKGYIVWLPMLEADTAATAAGRSLLSPDTRIGQGWDAGSVIGAQFEKTLRLTRMAWDVYLVYAPGVVWEADNLPPFPGFWMHQLWADSDADPALFLDAARLSAAVENELAKIAGAGPAGVRLESAVRCPHCGLVAQETMPVDACQIRYDCRNCKTMLRPKPGDCCVFCSYGSVKCPPIQQEPGCCDQAG